MVAFFWTAIESVGTSLKDQVDARSDQPNAKVRQIFVEVRTASNLKFVFQFGPESELMPEVIGSFYHEGQMQLARSYDFDAWAAHKFSSKHKNLVLDSGICGCFCCITMFPPAKVEKWIDEDERGDGMTAMCPNCGIDAVLPSNCGYPVTLAFLERMAHVWFGRSS